VLKAKIGEGKIEVVEFSLSEMMEVAHFSENE